MGLPADNLLHVFQGNWFLLGLADTAMNGVVDHEGLVLTLPGAVNV